MMGLLIVGMTRLVSCKKDWTCDCNGTVTTQYSDGNGGTSSTSQQVNAHSLIIDEKKSTAGNICEESGKTAEVAYSNTPNVDVVYDCNITPK